MAISHDTRDGELFKASPPPTTTERLLIHEHGDLHNIIVNQLNNGCTLRQVGEALGVSHSWVRDWLTRHGYVSQYVRVSQAVDDE